MLAVSVRRTPPLTSSVPGTCSTPVRGSDFEKTSDATNSNGSAVKHGLSKAMGAVWYYQLSNPPMNRMGRRTLERILADEPES
jgi:hypothetical protein